MTVEKKDLYKITLTHSDTGEKPLDREVPADVALRIINIAMGASVVATENEHHDTNLGIQNDDEIVSSAKGFIAKRKPQSDVERIACLAYYLNTYESLHAFKTRDLTRLNTEAAQPSFSNPAQSAKNAFSAGYIVAAGGGKRQISQVGEDLVKALPDRLKVSEVLAEHRKTRSNKKKKKK